VRRLGEKRESTKWENEKKPQKKRNRTRKTKWRLKTTVHQCTRLDKTEYRHWLFVLVIPFAFVDVAVVVDEMVEIADVVVVGIVVVAVVVQFQICFVVDLIVWLWTEVADHRIL